MVKINSRLLPIKAHFFFFMASMGPILPQLSVYGKQLGISPEIMGYITAILPLMYVIAKPLFGFVADYFAKFRKFIFLLLMMTMATSYAGLYFLQIPKPHRVGNSEHWNITINTSNINVCKPEVFNRDSLCSITRFGACKIENRSIPTYATTISATKIFNLKPNVNMTSANNEPLYICFPTQNDSLKFEMENCTLGSSEEQPDCVYDSSRFWIFVVVMCIGTISFNVTNSISDAICFDVLGDEQLMKYGNQRVWGTIGFGIAAVLSGIAVDLWTFDAVKSFTPAIFVMLIFSGLDLLSVSKLQMPAFTSSESIFKEICSLIRQKEITIFLVFATVAGVIDSFIIYFMFWHLEEVAEVTGFMHQIKLIEGIVVAAECLAGEIPIFFYSGKIIKKLGYVHCLSFCFFAYAVRLALIGWIPNPWYLVAVEICMQGLTYALCYSVIVGYAAAIAPAGTSATVQGLVAGMDDGLGYAIGSLIGGLSFKHYGGQRSFLMFSVGALITCIIHILIRPGAKHKLYLPKSEYHVPMEQVIFNNSQSNPQSCEHLH